jgi:dienelactone hydrolase
MIDICEVEYQADGKTMRGHLAWPTAEGLHPGVLIGHEGIGLNDFQRERADRLAECGYIAFAMDYHAGRWFSDPGEMMSVLGPLIADPARMRDIGSAALQVLLDHPQIDPHRVAAIGYGTGGTIALELGRAGASLVAIAAVNPVLPTAHAEAWANVRCPILVCVGSEDPLAPPARLSTFADEMRAAGTDWQLVVYGGAEHAFHLPPLNPDGSLSTGEGHERPTPGVCYHHLHAQRAWRAVLEHLDETLGGAGLAEVDASSTDG